MMNFQRQAPWLDRRVRTGSIDWHVQHLPLGRARADELERYPVCLLVHGTGSSANSWDALAAQFSAGTLDVAASPPIPGSASGARMSAGLDAHLLAVDLPGHARTRCPDSTNLSLDSVASALHQLLLHLNCQPCWMIGHSAGAAILLQLHLAYERTPARFVSLNGAILPLRGLPGWLFSPLARLSGSSRAMARFFAWRAQNPATLMKLLDSTGSQIDDAMLAMYSQLFRQVEHVGGVLRLMASWHLEALAARLPETHCRVELLAGDHDRTIALADAHRLAALLPDCGLHVLAGLGHLMHEEAPARLARSLIPLMQESAHAHDTPVARSA